MLGELVRGELLRTQNFIAGRWQPAQAGALLDVVDPATLATIGANGSVMINTGSLNLRIANSRTMSGTLRYSDGQITTSHDAMRASLSSSDIYVVVIVQRGSSHIRR